MLKSLGRGLTGWFRPVDGRAVATAPVAGPELARWEPILQQANAGDVAGALRAAEAELERNPGDRDACYAAGLIALRHAHDFPRAVHYLQQAVHADNRFGAAHWALVESLRATGREDDALAACERMLECVPDHVDALIVCGELQSERGRLDDAADNFNVALALSPESNAARLGLAGIYIAAGESVPATALLREVLAAEPANVQAVAALGKLLGEAGDVAGAVAVYEAGLRCTPDEPALLVNLGYIVLSQQGDPRAAEALFRRALEMAPDMLEAKSNLGLAIQEQGRQREVLAYYDGMVRQHPDFVEFAWNRALALLAAGDFARGWDGYELRKVRFGGSEGRRFPLQEWDGSALTGRALLVYGEQGVGDEIMFASCLPDVIAAAGSCVIECNQRLAPLFARSFPSAQVHGAPRDGDRSWLARHPDLELQCAIGSLPRFVRRSRDAFPDHHGYLVADADRAEHWRTRIHASGARLNVGISWRGGTAKTRRELRSTCIADWASLLDTPDVCFWALQGGNRDDGARVADGKRLRFDDIERLETDLDELAAAVSVLDLVITVGNTVGHVAGALGRPSWLLLPFSAEWRHLREGTQSMWYPSAQLFRQPAPGDWATVFRSVHAALIQRMTAKR